MLDATGTCTIFSSYALNTTAPDSLKYALCFKSVKQWEEFGKPDSGGMYCLKKYDIAGDGIITRDFVTTSPGATPGGAAVEFCKAQCAAMAECEFSVAQGAKCYLKKSIQGGRAGSDGSDAMA